MRRLFLLTALLAPVVSMNAARGADAGPRLAFPLDCTLGKTCWIQHYVDRVPAPGAKDYTCGTLTYAGHDGTDIRVADMAAEQRGVNVVAAADGQVLRLRDDMPDISVRATGVAAVKDRECGNGLVIDHGGGWQTQYCHMAKGSIVVQPGQRVKTGQVLGHAGLSGETEFPHLHFTVRRDGAAVDPFAIQPGEAGRCGGGVSQWAQTPAYVPRSVINAGFTAHTLDMAMIEAGGIAPPDAGAPYLVAYVRAIGLKAGDATVLTLYGPDKSVMAQTPAEVLDKNQTQRFTLVGKRRLTTSWPPGLYRAHYVVSSAEHVVLQHDFSFALKGGAAEKVTP